MLLLCGAIAAASYLKSDLTNNDFEHFADLRLSALFFVLFTGLCAAYVALYRTHPTIAPPTLFITAIVLAALFFVCFPIGSKDIFGYAFYGKMWGHYGANPYGQPPATFPADPWQAFIQVRWRTLPFAYGPLFLWQCWLVDAVAGNHLWLALWLHKACATVSLFAVISFAAAMSRSSASTTKPLDQFPLLLLAWNPLLLFESAAGAHNDIAMLLFLVAALWCWQARLRIGTMALLALAFWYKWYSLLFVPVFLLDVFKALGPRQAARQAAVWLGATGGFGLLLLAQLPGTLPLITSSLLHPGAMSGIFPNELSPPLAAIFWSLRGAGLLASDTGVGIFDISRFALFGAAVGYTFFRQWRMGSSLQAVVESCFLLSCAFFLLLITMLLPWHLLTVVGLGLLCRREPFLCAAVVLTALALLSYFLTFAVATLMVGAVVGAVWLLRRTSTASAGRGLATFKSPQ